MLRTLLNGAVDRTYLHGPRGPEYERIGNNAPVWYLYDGLGSVLGTVDQNGNVASTLKYDVYGAVRGSTGPGGTRHQFVGSLGHPSDGETGLIYMRMRYYPISNKLNETMKGSRTMRRDHFYQRQSPSQAGGVVYRYPRLKPTLQFALMLPGYVFIVLYSLQQVSTTVLMLLIMLAPGALLLLLMLAGTIYRAFMTGILVEEAGILFFRRNSSVFVPWDEIKEVILKPGKLEVQSAQETFKIGKELIGFNELVRTLEQCKLR